MTPSLLLLLLAPVDAHAADIVANVGFLDVLTFPSPEQIGPYGYVGGSVILPATDNLAIIPGLSVEYSPTLKAWGFVGTGVFSYAVSDGMAVDGIVTLLHDQAGMDFENLALYGGLGAGVSVFAGDFTISPSVSIYQGLVGIEGASFAPLLNVGYLL